MKVAIIGPSSSGKTTLASILAKVNRISHVNLDKVFIDWEKTSKKKFVFKSKEEVEKKICKVLKKNNWIIEGIYPIDDILKKADIIIFLKTGFFVSIIWQWYRFLNSPMQQEKFGFVNCLALSAIIFQQHYSKSENFLVYGRNYEYYSMRGFEKVLEPFKGKVYQVSTKEDKNLVKMELRDLIRSAVSL